VFETISPILINPKRSSISISLSKRFLLFQFMNKLVNQIEDDPYLNFISVLKNYKVLGKFLHGTVNELYRDRNKFYFKRFFYDGELYTLVKEEIENLYPKYKEIKVIISKHGVIVYDNYKVNDFNVLLLTIHAGTWAPKDIQDKMSISKKERFVQEDVDSDKIYRKIVLDKGGVWINNKLSRFVCDFNRVQNRCIYFNKKEKWLSKNIWNAGLKKQDINKIHYWHIEFYETLQNLLNTYNFNIIFDGHTMQDKLGRPKISFGTRYISPFYRPIVRSMRSKLRSLGYKKIYFNNPYSGGFILKWLNIKFPNLFIFSMEINKKEYMVSDKTRTLKRKLNKKSNDIFNMFDIK